MECGNCDKSWDTTNCMRNNELSNQNEESKCMLCQEEFREAVNLEDHLVRIHHKHRNFVCNKCNADFVMKQSFRKHIQGHHISSRRTCHYYNNEKDCPFQTVGCRFLHDKATLCRYGDQCSLSKCQYRHK